MKKLMKKLKVILPVLIFCFHPALSFAQFGICPDQISDHDPVYLTDYDQKTLGEVVGCTFWSGQYKVVLHGDSTIYIYSMEMLARANGCSDHPRICLGEKGTSAYGNGTVIGIVPDNGLYLEDQNGALSVVNAAAFNSTSHPTPPTPQPQPAPNPNPPNPNPPHPAPGPHSYTCQLNVGRKTLQGVGDSRAEAVQDVMDQCKEISDACRASDVSCMRE